MKIILNILIVAAIAFLGYLLYNSIEEPIAFKNHYDKREEVVANKLKDIRQAQEYYKDITGQYASDFDSLVYVLKTGDFPIIKVEENLENPEEFIYDTTYVSAIDSINNMGWNVNLDSLSYVPFSGGEQFSIYADTLTYQSTLTHVVEVGTKYKTFMGEYGDPKYKKYDNNYEPEKTMKFGSRTKPSLSGNW